MMAARPSPAGAWVFAVSMFAVAVGSWWWRGNLSDAATVELPVQSWKEAESRYPFPEEVSLADGLTQEVLSELVESNPFSPLRRHVPEPAGTVRAAPVPSGGADQQVLLQFKGLIQLGERQRAIVEDVGAKKAHFLEVGQEVAGYKLLDITESRVLLSDVSTGEEVTLFRSSEASPAKIRGAGAQ